MTGARHVVEAPAEPLGHDGIEDGVEDGVEVVEDPGDHEEDVLGVLRAGAPLPVQRHHHEHQPLAVEGDPADEEGHHHHHCVILLSTIEIFSE